MVLPEDVQRKLQNRGEEAAVRLLCRSYGMSGEAARAWVQARGILIPIESRCPEMRLNTRTATFLMVGAFLAGMAIAAVKQAI